jgi:hypothetical protein
MMRRNTIILVVIFLVMLGGILYINQDSNLQTSLGMQTATPTQQPKVVTGLDLEAAETFELTSTNGSNVKVAPVVNGDKKNWYTDKNELVSMQSVGQALQIMMELQGTVSPDQSIPLDKIGLNPPQSKLTITDDKGNKGTLYIGSQSATQSNYYVKWENNPVVLVSTSQIDSILSNFAPDKLVAPTPLPNITLTP